MLWLKTLAVVNSESQKDILFEGKTEQLVDSLGDFQAEVEEERQLHYLPKVKAEAIVDARADRRHTGRF